MHASTCPCRACRAAQRAAFEAESFEYEADEFSSSELEYQLTEAEEVELAMELLTVSTEAEMEQFLGKVFKGVWKGIKKVARPLGGVLKAVAKKALPFVGGALGSFIPIPGVGTAVGSALGGALSKALEFEYGELEQDEAEFEMARRFVRIAATAARQTAAVPASADLERAANDAVIAAARRHLARTDLGELESVASPAFGARHSGRWIRQKGNIVVVGV
jgi:uncharacterized protein (DUF697 family)